MSASLPPELRPLGIGELVDRSVHVWRQHFGPLFRLYLGFQLGVFILSKLFELAMYRWFPLVASGPALTRAMQETPGEVARQMGLFWLFAAVLVGAGVWMGWYVAVAGTHYLVRRLTLQPSASIREGLRRATSRLGTLSVAFLLSSVWGIVVVTLSALPGAALVWLALRPGGTADPRLALVIAGAGMLVAFFGVLAAGVWYVLRFVLTAQVIALEDVTAVGALKRSGALVSGRVGPGALGLVKLRATILLTLIFAVLTVVGLLGSAPAFIVQAIYANPLDAAHANREAIPQLLYVPAQLIQVVAQAVFSPLYLVFGALLYVDMRVRREGLDIELQLQRPAA